MARSKQPTSQLSEHELTCRAGEKLAKKKGLPFSDFRHVDILFHNGKRWAVETNWQQLIDGQWVDVDWTEFSSHST